MAADLPKAALSQEAIARELVVGLEQVAVTTRSAAAGHSPEPLLRVSSWSHQGGLFANVRLGVEEGEILAVVGVEGSGARELVASLAGFERATGDAETGSRGASAGRSGLLVAYLPPDRRSSLFFNYSVGRNLVSRLGSPAIASRAGFLRMQAIARLGEALRNRFRVRAQSTRQSVRALSGGNQQKVAIAAAIARQPGLLVLQEPTRGVDIGSKAEIYAILREYAHQRNAVITFCTEIPEVFELADRVVVVGDGRVSQPLRVEAYPDITSLTTAVAKIEQTLPIAGPDPGYSKTP
jgi:ABC-type sugar transport system ATPase subunit